VNNPVYSYCLHLHTYNMKTEKCLLVYKILAIFYAHRYAYQNYYMI